MKSKNDEVSGNTRSKGSPTQGENFNTTKDAVMGSEFGDSIPKLNFLETETLEENLRKSKIISPANLLPVGSPTSMQSPSHPDQSSPKGKNRLSDFMAHSHDGIHHQKSGIDINLVKLVNPEDEQICLLDDLADSRSNNSSKGLSSGFTSVTSEEQCDFLQMKSKNKYCNYSDSEVRNDSSDENTDEDSLDNHVLTGGNKVLNSQFSDVCTSTHSNSRSPNYYVSEHVPSTEKTLYVNNEKNCESPVNHSISNRNKEAIAPHMAGPVRNFSPQYAGIKQENFSAGNITSSRSLHNPLPSLSNRDQIYDNPSPANTESPPAFRSTPSSDHSPVILQRDSAPVNVLENARKILGNHSKTRGYPLIEEQEFRFHATDFEFLGPDARSETPIFKFAGCEWSIVYFPNKATNDGEVSSLYLKLVTKPESLQYIAVDFVLGMIHPTRESNHKLQFSCKRFEEVNSDWGFTSFAYLRDIYDTDKGFVRNGETVLFVLLRAYEDITGTLFMEMSNFDPKKFLGYVGLRNQGATCYMNSLLQSLFFTNIFRKAIYHIPPTSSGSNENLLTLRSYGVPLADRYKYTNTSVTEALQRLFYFMQYSNRAPETQQLTQSFGWKNSDIIAQHDVQEFLRLLVDTLEKKTKNTHVDGILQALFLGQTISRVKCLNIDYQSCRLEDFYDIQLNVKGMKNLEQSFESYTASEMLVGNNKYETEGYGHQDAKMMVKFAKLPPVLHLVLKRFDMDYAHNRLVKINDRVEFPLVMNLDRFCDTEKIPFNDSEELGIPESKSSSIPMEVEVEDKNSSTKAKEKGGKIEKLAESFNEKPVNQIYHLHGVLVHAGKVDSGHYTVFIRPERKNAWMKFNDDTVYPVTPTEAMDDNFGTDPDAVESCEGGSFQSNDFFSRTTRSGLNYGGGTHSNMNIRSITNAYILVYIRECDYDRVLCPVGKDEIPEWIRTRYDAEIAEMEAKEKDRFENQFMTKINIFTRESITGHKGFGVFEMSQGVHFTKKYNNNLNYCDISKDLFDSLNCNQATNTLIPIVYRPRIGYRISAVMQRNLENHKDEPLLSLRKKIVPTESKQMGFYLVPSADLSKFSQDSFAKIQSFDHLTASSEYQVDVAVLNTDSKDDEAYGGLPPPYNELSEETQAPLTSECTILFVKEFDFTTQTLSVLGHVTLAKLSKKDLVSCIRKLLNCSDNVKLCIWEEVSYSAISEIDDQSFFPNTKKSLTTGSIIVVQRQIVEKSTFSPGNVVKEQIFTDAAAYYKHLFNLVLVTFHLNHNDSSSSLSFREKNDSPSICANEDTANSNIDSLESKEKFLPSVFTLTVSLTDTYDEFAGKIAKRLSLKDPMMLRFWDFNKETGMPDNLLSRIYTKTISDFFMPRYLPAITTYGENHMRMCELYYEVKKLSIIEQEKKRLLIIVIINPGFQREKVEMEIALEVTFAELGSILCTGHLKDSGAIVDFFCCGGGWKITDMLDPAMTVGDIPQREVVLMQVRDKDFAMVKGVSPGKQLIFAAQYFGPPYNICRLPFVVWLRPNELFRKTKLRIYNLLRFTKDSSFSFHEVVFKLMPMSIDANSRKDIIIGDNIDLFQFVNKEAETYTLFLYHGQEISKEISANYKNSSKVNMINSGNDTVQNY